MTDMNPCVLAELSHAQVRDQKWEVAVLPFGATEAHNFHLPYGTDNYQVEAIGRRACAYAGERGARVLLLPTVPFGVNTNHLQVPGGLALSVTPTTLLKLLADLVDSLERQGVRKLVLLNGHGGNELKPLCRELHHRTRLFLCVCDWFRVIPDLRRDLLERPGEHADEMETSLMLALHPERVHLDQAGSGKPAATPFEAVEQGWVSMIRPWHLASPDTGIGDPSRASTRKGETMLRVLTERIGAFLVQLSNAEMTDRFPFK